MYANDDVADDHAAPIKVLPHCGEVLGAQTPSRMAKDLYHANPGDRQSDAAIGRGERMADVNPECSGFTPGRGGSSIASGGIKDASAVIPKLPLLSPLNLTFVVGDIAKANDNFTVHQCNCVTPAAKGLAGTLFKAFPDADVYSSRRITNRFDEPGSIDIR